MELNARVHAENGAYWAEVAELPGCFASGETLDELTEALRESVGLYLTDSGTASDGVRLTELKLSA
jgi:predicted RNase H-like HicB family nuclease